MLAKCTRFTVTKVITVNPFFRVPFISRIWRAWQVREYNGLRKFEYSSVSV